MKKGITISLIIATYNWPEALRLCLDSILRQTILPSEIIIADDCSTDLTTEIDENSYMSLHKMLPFLYSTNGMKTEDFVKQ